MRTRILMLAKQPVPGRVKTRLCPPCTPGQAAALAEAALRDTLRAAFAAHGAERRVVALAGDPGDWLPAGFDVVPQRGAGLAERLAAAFGDVGGPALLIGMDTPQVTAALLDRALDRLTMTDAVFGPALDGGYWAIGLRRPDRRVFEGVPMSVETTGAVQRRRLAELGLRVTGLPVLRDVDTIADARAVAAAAPACRFADELHAIEPSVVAA
jgi:rSAM/selenodomain-associated transferase 1